MTTEQYADVSAVFNTRIAELERQLAVAQYERDLCADDIAKKDARIAELERENIRLNARITQAENQMQLFYGSEFDAVMKAQRFSAALKVAWEGIEKAPCSESCASSGSAAVQPDCDCWKIKVLAAIGASLHRGTGSPLPPVQHLGAARTAPVFSDEKDR